jgi:hypothetical protein
MNDRDKMVIWLGKPINNNYLYFDFLSNHFQNIMAYLKNKNIKLRENIDENIFFIRFLALIYENSKINI